MKTKFIEATNGPQNWGKFMLARFEREEWHRPSAISAQIGGGAYSLLRAIGTNPAALLVFDLQTGEGASFMPGGSAAVDLERHQIWVCPLFEPFLAWLYTQDVTDLDALPAHVDLPDAPFAMRGYRRGGPTTAPAEMVEAMRAAVAAYREEARASRTQRTLSEAVRAIDADDHDYTASLDLTLGVLLGLKLYGCVAAVRRVMLSAGLEVGGLIASVLARDG